MMNKRWSVLILAALCLSPTVTNADVFEDVESYVAGDFWIATLSESFTAEDDVALLYDYVPYRSMIDGVGHSLFNGYAMTVGAYYGAHSRLVADGITDPWYTAPFTWLKENAALVPDLVARVRLKLRLDHLLFANYLLSAHDTITSQPDWQQKFAEIQQLYAEYARLDANPDLEWEAKRDWASEHHFGTTLGSFMWFELTPQEQARWASVMPDYVAWGLAKDWIGGRAMPSVVNTYVDRTLVNFSSVSFENYLASFWYRRWADGSLEVVHEALQLVSAVMPRDIARQASLGYGFADTIATELTRTGADWEIHPTPSAVVTFMLVGEDGKTPVVAPWTAVVPTAQPAGSFLPYSDAYLCIDGETLTPAQEGESATLVLRMQPL
jgi:hypothetical protein